MNPARLLAPQPDSLVARFRRDSPRTRAGRWYPLLMLVWSFWIVATPMFDRDLRERLPATLASYAVFLVLYAIAYVGERRWLKWSAAGIAALGFLITPVNPGAQGYVIYACAFVAFCVTGRTAVLTMLALLGMYAAECAWLGTSWVVVLSATLIGLSVGLMNVVQARNLQVNVELRLSHDEVRRLAAMAERERIGRDLHDLLGHTLSLIALKSELASRLWERDPQAARAHVREVERVAREALAQVRGAVTGMRTTGLAAELASARLLLEAAGIGFDYTLPDLRLPAALETALGLILREAATNIQRHSRASHASVHGRIKANRLLIDIADNGRGGALVPGNGLVGTRERIEALGGTLAIEAPPGQGTTLHIALPLGGGESVEPPPAASRVEADAPTLLPSGHVQA